MPSQLHEALLVLFRNRPELAPELLRGVVPELPHYTTARVEASDLTQALPAELRADCLILLSKERPVHAFVVEAQLTRDAKKELTWPLYTTSARARFGCLTTLLVVSPRIRVARWAARPIQIGVGHVLQPIVIGPDSIPIVTSRDLARDAPELAVLSALAHGRGDVETAVRIAAAATAGLRRLPDKDRVVLYSDLVLTALSNAARKAFEMLPAGYKVQSKLVKNWIAKGVADGLERGRAKGLTLGLKEGRQQGRALGREQGRAEGRQQGRAEGRQQGRAEGEISALRTAILAVIESRQLAVSQAQRARILKETGAATLERWLRRAATVSSVRAIWSK